MSPVRVDERDADGGIVSRIPTCQLSSQILGSTKSSEVSNVVKGLPQDAQDTLMKYIYKAMATHARSDANSSVLLSWHEKVRHTYIMANAP